MIYGSREEWLQLLGSLIVSDTAEDIALHPRSVGEESVRNVMVELLSDRTATADLFVGCILQQVRSHVKLIARPFTGLEEPYEVTLPVPDPRLREEFIDALKRAEPFLNTLGVVTSHASGIELTVDGLPGKTVIRMGADPTSEMLLGQSTLAAVVESCMSLATTSSMERAES